MNIILFDPLEDVTRLPRADPRAVHILDVLRKQPGDGFDAGLIDGPRGKATLVSLDDGGLGLSFVWGQEPPPLDPITLVIGLPRPQTARRLLHEASTMGVSAMHFVASDRGERSYSQSPLWQTLEWRRHLIDGAQQAFCTRLPRVTHHPGLAAAIATLPESGSRLALDNYQASLPLSRAKAQAPVVIAIGPEPGWSDGERDLLRRTGFELVHLGQRVLRTETAALAALSLVKSQLGLF